MIGGCICIVMSHKRRCGKTVTYSCDKCGDHLCGGCAKNHHPHKEVKKIPKEVGSGSFLKKMPWDPD